MPVRATYPGVYINEVKSRVRTITGVPTSIAAFVGTAPRGPVDDPVRITSWADYETHFGGLAEGSDMSYAVQQFYLNGGADAVIVRLVPRGAKALTFRVGKDSQGENRPLLKATSPGAWALGLRARVDYDKLPAGDEFYNLTIRDCGTGFEESYRTISADPDSPRSLRRVLSGSRLVVVEDEGTARPQAHDTPDPAPDDLLACPPAGRTGQPAEGGVPDGDADGDEDGDQLSSRPGKPENEPVEITATDYLGSELEKSGIHQLRKTDIFNLLCLPGCPPTVLPDALRLCVEQRAVLLVDPPSEWAEKTPDAVAQAALSTPPLPDEAAKNAALYFPEVMLPDRLRDGEIRNFPPCGVMAGVLARTDAQRGVWKAPAGTDATLTGVVGLRTPMTDAENGLLNPLGINCLRQLPGLGPVAWGARTLRGADHLSDEWKYLPVRRLALFIEESLFRGTQWVVFEPNDEPLWSSIRLNVGAFMNSLFREGAFQGRTPDEAYLVKCDRENNPQNDIDRGIVNIQVGFAPLKPAEFVIIHIEQLAGQIQT
ncbi:phage tail sheath subtilisin-like domain-containing protein [Streptomyces cinnabarinus]|uniref:Phage tail sheath subtilisin-like domain-containing protein n=1 Tax=Streptomyces cinnabarinus TaxID=67287 RepID=A0ABY7K886_9ACTN|nr:phage tail sheath C-terminal domain-containing protein [Streptomyces cinnabarinus]WAZ20005.1 phage tail sheath subtilisin-like domain-containing protein [Streptomyces cinnabarinus]